MKLENLNEINGILKSVEKKDDNLSLIFSINQKIELPLNSIPKEKLDSYLNKKIGILNCEGEYLIREIEE